MGIVLIEVADGTDLVDVVRREDDGVAVDRRFRGDERTIRIRDLEALERFARRRRDIVDVRGRLAVRHAHAERVGCAFRERETDGGRGLLRGFRSWFRRDRRRLLDDRSVRHRLPLPHRKPLRGHARAEHVLAERMDDRVGAFVGVDRHGHADVVRVVELRTLEHVELLLADAAKIVVRHEARELHIEERQVIVIEIGTVLVDETHHLLCVDAYCIRTVRVGAPLVPQHPREAHAAQWFDMARVDVTIDFVSCDRGATPRRLHDADGNRRIGLTHMLCERLSEETQRVCALGVGRGEPTLVGVVQCREIDIARCAPGDGEAHVRVGDRRGKVSHRELPLGVAVLCVRVAVVLRDVELHVRLPGREEDIPEHDVREDTHRRRRHAELDDVRRRRPRRRREGRGERTVVVDVHLRILDTFVGDHAHIERTQCVTEGGCGCGCVCCGGCVRCVCCGGCVRRGDVDGAADRNRHVALEHHVACVILRERDRRGGGLRRLRCGGCVGILGLRGM